MLLRKPDELFYMFRRLYEHNGNWIRLKEPGPIQAIGDQVDFVV